MKKKAEGVLALADGRISKAIALLPIVFYFTNLFRLITRNDSLYLMALFLSGCVGCLFLLCRQLIRKDMQKVLSVILLTLAFAVVNLLAVGNVDLGSLITEVMLFGLTFLILRYGNSSCDGEISFYFVAVIYIAYWMKGIDPKQIMSSSNNFVSVILLIALFFYYIPLEREGHGKIDSVRKILPTLLCVVLSGWSRGRAGILAVGFLMVGMIVLYCMQAAAPKRLFAWLKSQFTAPGKKNKVLILAVGIVLIVAVVVLVQVSGILKFLLGKFLTRGLASNARLRIWGDYFQHMFRSAGNFLLGVPLDEAPVVVKYDYNIHNSFLHIHADHGVLIFVLILAMLVMAAVYYWKRKMYLHCLLLGAFCIRAFFDKFISMQYGMPIMLYFIFYPLVRKQLCSPENNNGKESGETLNHGK